MWGVPRTILGDSSATECRSDQREASADMTQSGVITTTFEAVVQGRQVVKEFMQHSLER
jgi:hypothetical protein